MELTSLAAGLNALFYQTDSAILAFYHRLAQQAGAVLTPFFSALTLTAWKGALLVLISLALAAFPRTRRTGICALLALVIGALCTNILLKRLVDRPRPYDFDPLLRQWWEYAGSHQEHGGSFPSGHTTAGCAFTTGFLLTRGRRWIPAGVAYVLLLGASRNYLVVHYPSDVAAGIVVGAVAGCLSFLLVRALYRRWGTTRCCGREIKIHKSGFFHSSQRTSGAEK